MANKYLKFEQANGRTLGECIQAEIDSIKLIDGKFVPTVQIKKKPQRLNRQAAIKYYKSKLKNYWENPEK